MESVSFRVQKRVQISGENVEILHQVVFSGP